MGVRIDADENGLAEIGRIAVRVRNNALDDMAADAKRLAPVDTGELVLSVHADHAAGQLVADADHAAAVEMGARPHDIPNAFGRGFTAQHPGTKAQPYLRPAAYRSRVLHP
jgi:hypothetical protein